ncbi:MAG: hypothetical protein EOM83_07970 [Clostridia bacterium]|nr:hypothetical protein [Clostridia bacterium]
MIAKLFLIIITTVAGCGSMTQKLDKVEIERIKVFADFQEKGYTTAGASTHFDDLKNKGTEQIEISLSDKQELERIIQNAEKGKHRQTKLGIRHLFALMKFSGLKGESRVIINIGEERAFVVDLSHMIQYKITQPSHVKWLKDFREQCNK